MEDLLEFLREKCKKGLAEAKDKCIDHKLIEELEKVLGEWTISSPPDIKMKDTLYDLISALTDIIISHSHNRPAQIICAPLQIRSRPKKTLKHLRQIRDQLGGGATDSPAHGRETEEVGPPRWICKIMTDLKQRLFRGTKNKSPNQMGKDGVGSQTSVEGTSDRLSNEEKCFGPEALPKIEGEMFKKKLEEIKDCLNVQNRGGHIEIGIVGMCGSGKTTLACLVYCSEGVLKEFEHRIWVKLGTCFEQILGIILKHWEKGKGDEVQCGQGKVDEAQPRRIQELLRKIRKHLLGKSYLLVLDGVWDAHMDWYFELGKALDWHYKDGDVGNDGSKSAVIITTRLEEAAKTMVGISALHDINPCFTKDDCWSIFKNHVELRREFKANNATLLNELEDDIKEQCDGLPLAAVTLAGVIPQQIIRQQRVQSTAAPAPAPAPAPAQAESSITVQVPA